MNEHIKWWDCFSQELVPPEVEYWAIKSLLGALQRKLILEVGCGTGTHIEHYQKDDCKIVGIDFTPGMIKESLKRNPWADLILASATNLPFRPNIFDKGYSWGVYHYIPWWTQKHAIDEVYRVVKDRFVIHIFRMNRKWLGVWYRKYRYWRRSKGDPNYSTFAILNYKIFRKFRKVFIGIEKDILPYPDYNPCILVAIK